MDAQPMTIRLPREIYEKLRVRAFEGRTSQNAIIVEALTANLDDRTVALTTRGANQAERLRRMVRLHGAVGEPFPNNEHPTWQVCEAGEPVNPHGVASIAVKLAAHDPGESA
jgi:hypothetical protein